MPERVARLAELEIQVGGVVAQIDVVRLARDQRLAADRVLRRHLASGVGAEPRAIRFASRVISWIQTSAISSDDRQPHETRSGGWLGFLTFVSELSNTYSISSVVPAGTQKGDAYRY